MKYVIAYDMGTGGLKSSIFDENGVSVTSSFKQCETYYPAQDFREQKPEEWWDTFVAGTKELLSKTTINTKDIVAAACSGHSLGIVPMSKDGQLLADFVPIWSDARASKQANEVFSRLDEKDWYLKTGNGFPASLYSAFKILWYKENKPEIYNAADKFIGTKDFLNYRLTGVIGTDYSYASGSGVYDLIKCEYDQDLIKKIGLNPGIYPELYESSDVIGTIKSDVARELGLPENLLIAAGGVDNSCMAAGAGCVEDGTAYTSLGTSSWIAVTSNKPVLNYETKPYVFGHLIKGMYTSALSIFSGGNTYRWVRETFCRDFVEKEKAGGEDAYKIMDALAAQSTVGANGLFFVPTLAGGASMDKSPNARGSITGLDLGHTRSDIIRATLEGVCLGLRVALDELRSNVKLQDQMLIVGGGSKSPYWRQLFADIYGMQITESIVGENAGSLGAMACAAIGAGIWKDFKPLVGLNKPINTLYPNEENKTIYNGRIYKKFCKLNSYMSEFAEYNP
ncbi:MAG: FGGY-family carbohydrate kinase [Treponema sp.]|nr:FGGY-family carbohydrate kinase [Treponema sp.]